MLRPYRELAAVPGLGWVVAWCLFGRLHLAMSPVALTFLIAGSTGSFGIAGSVVAALMIGHAVSGPLRGRAADRRSAPRLVAGCVAGYVAGLTGLALLPGAWWPAALPLALVTGLFMPPVTQLGRASYPRLAGGAARDAAYSVDATLVQVVWVIGPALSAVVVAVAGAQMALGVTAAAAGIGALGFAGALVRVGLRDPVTAPDRARRWLLGERGLAAAIGSMMLLVAGFGAVQVALVGWAQERGTPAAAGLVAATWSAGALAGGLLLGARVSAGPPALWLRVAAVAAGLAVTAVAVPPVTGGDPAVIAVLLAVAGLPNAAAMGALTVRVGQLAPSWRGSEAFGWLTTAITLGQAFGSPVGGTLTDLLGPAAAVAGAALLVCASAALASLVAAVEPPIGAPPR
jgi:MFS family permease